MPHVQFQLNKLYGSEYIENVKKITIGGQTGEKQAMSVLTFDSPGSKFWSRCYTVSISRPVIGHFINRT